MKIPTRFRIGDRICKVSQKKQAVTLAGNECVGYFKTFTCEIWVSPDAHDKLQVFFHEFFHACFEEIGVKQANWSPDIEEILCEKLGRHMVGLLRTKK